MPFVDRCTAVEAAGGIEPEMKKMAMLMVTVLAATAGCNSKTKATPENYLATLNAYFPDHPECLLDSETRFPYETSDKAKTKQMDALVAAKLLTSSSEPAIHVTRYVMTDTGTRAGAHLCYGHREATAITSSTPPAKQNGFTETNVVYQYGMEDVPVWAKTPQVLAAWPEMAAKVGGGQTGKMTLALTGVGWSVPD